MLSVREIRERAQKSPLWRENIETLVNNNDPLYKQSITYEIMEKAYNYVLDQYDYAPYLIIENMEDHPFWSLMELDEQGEVENIYLWDTQDKEYLAEYLEEQYDVKDPYEGLGKNLLALLDDFCNNHTSTEQSIIKRDRNIITRFIDFLCENNVDSVEHITKGMVNSKFRSWCSSNYILWEREDISQSLQRFFCFLATEKKLVNEKILKALSE